MLSQKLSNCLYTPEPLNFKLPGKDTIIMNSGIGSLKALFPYLEKHINNNTIILLDPFKLVFGVSGGAFVFRFV